MAPFKISNSPNHNRQAHRNITTNTLPLSPAARRYRSLFIYSIVLYQLWPGRGSRPITRDRLQERGGQGANRRAKFFDCEGEQEETGRDSDPQSMETPAPNERPARPLTKKTIQTTGCSTPTSN